MAYPTAVNNQITDAVTQTNVKVLGDAPAMAIGSLYQTMTHALSLAAQNAVMSQQQMNVTLQAAATEGAVTLYAVLGSETTSALAGNASAAPATVAEAPPAVALSTAPAAEPCTAGNVSPLSHNLSAPSPSEQIEQAVQFVDKLVLGASDDVAQAMQKIMTAFSSAMSELAVLSEGQALAVVRTAATASCWAAMIRAPEKAAAYDGVLNSIRSM